MDLHHSRLVWTTATVSQIQYQRLGFQERGLRGLSRFDASAGCDMRNEFVGILILLALRPALTSVFATAEDAIYFTGQYNQSRHCYEDTKASMQMNYACSFQLRKVDLSCREKQTWLYKSEGRSDGQGRHLAPHDLSEKPSA